MAIADAAYRLQAATDDMHHSSEVFDDSNLYLRVFRPFELTADTLVPPALVNVHTQGFYAFLFLS